MCPAENVSTELTRIGISDIIKLVDCSNNGRYVYLVENKNFGCGYPTLPLLEAMQGIADGALSPDRMQEQEGADWNRGDAYSWMVKEVLFFGYAMNPGADTMPTPETSWVLGDHPGDYRRTDMSWGDIWQGGNQPELVSPQAGDVEPHVPGCR